MGLRMFIGNLQIGRIEIPGDQSVREAFHLAVKRLFSFESRTESS